ncbi:MAG: YihA family ribosome biogenesis GTP-binding protein, partial [Bacteroidetes bacterium]|nr:YihA family ribosome biogenesis GTP-binding protein [Bacteroidota bacterium]
FAIVYTKTDKSTLNKINQNIQAFERELLKEWEELPPSFRTSANTKDGIEKITSYIDQLNKEVELLKD